MPKIVKKMSISKQKLNKKNGPRERLLFVREMSGLSKTEFAKRLSLNSTRTLNNLNVSEFTAKKVQFFFGYRWEWILYGTGEQKYY